MARQRRGGGFRPELRGTLGTLLRTTLEQAGAVRSALERGAREGRSRLDEALSGRRRKDALAELGELVLDLIRRGEIDLGELPEAQEIVRFLDELDADDAPTSEEEERIAQAPTRGRFDSRGRERDRSRGGGGDGDDADDGTVSALRRGDARGSGPSPGSGTARRWSPSKPSAPQRVWRPSLADEDPPSDPRDSGEPREARDARPARSVPRDPHRKGGIQFDDDADLADYMHPDDVPPKPPSDDDR